MSAPGRLGLRSGEMNLPGILSEDLGGSALARAARRGDLLHWYASPPASVDAWKTRAAAVAGTHSVGWLDLVMPAFGTPDSVVMSRLSSVARGRGVVVTTGQQPGLFGGPLYTLSKALTAVTLAEAIQRETGIPAAPVFWAATDDADFDEASRTRVAAVGRVALLELGNRPPPGTAMSDAPLGVVDPLITQLWELCGSVLDPAVLRAVEDAYRPESTVGGAYVALLRRLLEPLGVGVIDASHLAVRVAGRSLLHSAAARAAALERALGDRSRDLRAAGYAPQVETVPGLSLVFTTIDGRKRRLTVNEAGAASAALPPEALSPNVLLRPVLERSILPTVGYVGGPGEIAYFAQVSAVACVLEAPVPLVVPRWSCTLIEPRIKRILDRLDAVPEDVRDPHALETRLARKALPASIATALRHINASVTRDIDALEAADLDNFVPTASLGVLRRAIAHRIDRLERRYVAATKRREEASMGDVATARAALFPDGGRQERTLGFVAFLARYGGGLVTEMRAHAAAHSSALITGVPTPPGADRVKITGVV